MKPQSFVHGLLFAGFRLAGGLLLVLGGLTLLFQFTETWFQFDPSYLRAFAFSLFFRPLVLIATGLGLYRCAPRLARLASRTFRESEE